MIHIIPQHISKGSYTEWYKLLNIKDEHIFHLFDDTYEIENKLIGEPPYIDKLIEKLDTINPQFGDVVIFDCRYINSYNGQLAIETHLIELSKKYNDCKFVLFDDDNFVEYIDTAQYTFFSNKFIVRDTNELYHYEHNCNYYRYRSPLQEYFPHLEYIIKIFDLNIRQKKMNMIIGVDKKERLDVFEYVYNIGLNSDSWLGYSAFTCNYDDTDISAKLLEFKKNKLPVILDTPMERSMQGSVNVEIPPLPITMTSYISCILETMVVAEDIIHLSEKSWNPFISKNIPLILGNKYLTQYLKDLGFWLAEDLFDISPQDSVSAIINQYKRNLDIIHKMSYKDIHSYYVKNQAKIEQNFSKMQTVKFEFKLDNYLKPIKTKFLK
jgi:hypothetical protein